MKNIISFSQNESFSHHKTLRNSQYFFEIFVISINLVDFNK